MILVLLGTQDKPFTRLIEAVDDCINKGIIKDKVVAQMGFTKYETNNIEMIELMPYDDYIKYNKEADLIITHGGVGSILTALQLNKKVIAMPRLEEYGEHTNNHQIQIINEFYKTGYILKVDNPQNLGNVISESKKFKPKKYISNNKKFINMLEDYIDNI